MSGERPLSPLAVAAGELLMAERAGDPMSHILAELGSDAALQRLAEAGVPYARATAERLGVEPEVVAYIRGALTGALAQRAAERRRGADPRDHPHPERE